VDPRVDALAPMVIDMLNMPVQMKHQLDSWGEYSEEIGDYTSLQLQKYLQTPPGQSLVNIVDPYRYRDRIQQPKLLIFGTNDRYWPIDACNIYWNELSGPKYLLYTPNQGHGIKDVMRLVGSVSALQRSRLGQFVMPELKWESKCVDGKMTLRMNADRKPMEVNLWTAKSSTKDFRNSEWTSSIISVNGENVCSVEPELPTSGYQAWFGEWKFENEQYPAFFSTNMILSTQKP
jgi:PhoPQ-activated pathogenicity-related protein